MGLFTLRTLLSPLGYLRGSQSPRAVYLGGGTSLTHCLHRHCWSFRCTWSSCFPFLRCGEVKEAQGNLPPPISRQERSPVALSSGCPLALETGWLLKAVHNCAGHYWGGGEDIAMTW